MRASEADLAYFWSDGCYATKLYKDSYLKNQIAQIELHKERVRQEDSEWSLYSLDM